MTGEALGTEETFGTGETFGGAKIALLSGEMLVAYRRDDLPDIPWPGLWDLPGGGREGGEAPEACALREVEEEFGLRLSTDRILWARCYPPRRAGALPSHFFVAPVTETEIAAIRFGEEGQYWTMMAIADFLAAADAVPHLQDRLRDYLGTE